MLALNGYPILDFTLRQLKPDAILSNIRPPDSAQLVMDGTTASLDAVHLTTPTRTGGVAGAWSHASNWQYIKGAAAPVISEATDNLDANADCIFSPWGSINWAAINGAAIAANTDGLMGSSSMKITCGANVDGGAQLATAATAGQPYTCSCYVKANNAGAVGETFRANYDGTTADVTLTADWQLLKVTDASASGVAVNAQLYFTGGENGDEVLVTAWQRENKLYATPFALDSRTASTLTFPTASLGLVAGQDMSIVVVTKTPWVGNDGVSHFLFEIRDALVNIIRVNKSNLNVIGLYIYQAGNLKTKTLAVDAVNWAADTTHVIIATVDAANTQQIFLDGVAGAVSAGAFPREDALAATTYIGTSNANSAHANAPLLVAIFRRILSSAEIAYISKMGAWFPDLSGEVVVW